MACRKYPMIIDTLEFASLYPGLTWSRTLANCSGTPYMANMTRKQLAVSLYALSGWLKSMVYGNLKGFEYGSGR